MSKTILWAAAIAVTASALPAFAAIATPHAAGSMQSPDWQPGADPLTETALGSGIWTRTFSGLTPGGRFEYKITDGTWDASYPGPNAWGFADATGNLTITYDTNTYADGFSPATERLISQVDPGTWVAVGNFQSEVGGSDWDNANPFTAMTPLGGGLYEFNAYIAPGSWEWKAVITGSWDSIAGDGRNVNTAAWGFTLNAGEYAQMQINAIDGTARLQVLPIPEPATLGLAGLAVVGLLSRRRAHI